MTKITAIIVLFAVIASTLSLGVHRISSLRGGCVDGLDTFGDVDCEAAFDEICADAKIDEDDVLRAYHWVIHNLL